MRRKFFITTVCLPVLIWFGHMLGCTSSTEPKHDSIPAWLESVPKDDRYFYGLGISGPTRKIADAWNQATLRARAELGKTIISHVTSYDLIISTNRSEYTKQLLQLLSDTELNYTEVIERWHDRHGAYSSPDHYYVLVRMEKKQARQVLQQLK